MVHEISVVKNFARVVVTADQEGYATVRGVAGRFRVKRYYQ